MTDLENEGIEAPGEHEFAEKNRLRRQHHGRHAVQARRVRRRLGGAFGNLRGQSGEFGHKKWQELIKGTSLEGETE